MSEKVWDKLKQELKDFCVSNCFDDVVMGLSGGIDSALTAVLAADTLGGDKVTALMMRTKYTSPLSLEIAREITKLNGLKYHEFDIQHLIDEEVSFLTQAFGQEPKGVVIEQIGSRNRLLYFVR